MSESEFVENLEQEEFDTQKRERERQREIPEDLQVLQEFYTHVLLLCLVDRYIEESVEVSRSFGI